jgi:peptide/nickel transport system substrate-binding protein
MSISRRTALGTGLAFATAPSILRAQSRPSAARTIRAIIQGDIATYDPIWTTANTAAYHGAMVYDTLFGMDATYKSQPQMVSKFGKSDDGKTWTFELRDGLKFSDGTPVTTADVIPSIHRWSVRSGSGQLLMQRVASVERKDDKTFVFNMKEPFPLIIDILGNTTTPLLFIMRKKEAETDPMQKISTVLGSGPFIFNEGATKPGSEYAYDKNPNYVPRQDPASGIAGGKIVKVDRVVMMSVPDSQTSLAALQSGEVDMVEQPPVDFLDQLASDPNIALLDLFKLGTVGYTGLNWLHPPFNNQKVRQAMLYIQKQDDMLRPTFVSEKYYKTCGSWFTCGSPMANDANTDWFKHGQDFDKARQLMKEGGYDGRPVVVMQATSMEYMRNAATVLADAMRRAGFNVDLQPMDWANVVQRRASKAPPEQGGWNIFFTSAGGLSQSNPYMVTNMACTGDKAWFGWPSDEPYEQIRDKWVRASSEDDRKKIAVELQQRAWDIVPHLYYGQWNQPIAHRKNVQGWLPVPEIIPFWNLTKT